VGEEVKAIKVAPKVYKLRGITHTCPRYCGAAVCGGQVFAERFPGEEDDDGPIPPSWECYCETCGDCDPNGWATLRECLAEAPEFWLAEVTTP